MRIENIANVMQRLEVAHLISTLFQNAEKAAKIVSSQNAQNIINESTQKPQSIEKPSEVEDEKQQKKRKSKNPHSLDVLA